MSWEGSIPTIKTKRIKTKRAYVHDGRWMLVPNEPCPPIDIELTSCYDCSSCFLRFKCFSTRDMIDINTDELNEYVRRGKWKTLKLIWKKLKRN